MKTIDTTKINQAMNLLSKAEYEIIKSEKKAKITLQEDTDGFMYDCYKSNLIDDAEIIKNNIIGIFNSNRDYSNIFKDYENTYIDKDKLSSLTKSELLNILDIEIDKEGYITLSLDTDLSEDKEDKLKEKIMKDISIVKSTARGYSQGDWEEYIFITYKHISKENNTILLSIIENIKHLFTVAEYAVYTYTTITKQYNDMTTEEEDIDEDTEYTSSYEGYNSKLEKELTDDLLSKGYTIIEN